MTNGGARNAIYTIASTMNATKMKSRYMLVQRYICQATLLPSFFQTRHAPQIIHNPNTRAETRYTLERLKRLLYEFKNSKVDKAH